MPGISKFSKSDIAAHMVNAIEKESEAANIYENALKRIAGLKEVSDEEDACHFAIAIADAALKRVKEL